MIITSSKDQIMFYEHRKECKELYYDIDFPVCRTTGRLCNEDTCPIVSKIDVFDEFVNIVREK